MPLTYYASQIAADKPHQLETPEGYRVYKDVPVARTGMQEYLGKELKGNPGYQSEWGLNDDDLYDVLRPVEEVTHADTLASFEGKSVVDGHPPGDDLILYPEIDSKYNRGHGQNVRVGDKLADGETPLLSDLMVKDADLNDKIDEGLREVSCGYTYKLAKDDQGRLIQTEIRGNHFAIVPKGRAGSHIAIQDAAPETKEEITVEQQKKTLWGRLLQAFAKDAKPEEVAEASAMLHRAAMDAEPEEGKKMEEPEVKKEAQPEKAVTDASAKLEQLKKLLMDFFTEEESEPAHADDADPEDKLEEAKEKAEATPTFSWGQRDTFTLSVAVKGIQSARLRMMRLKSPAKKAIPGPETLRNFCESSLRW